MKIAYRQGDVLLFKVEKIPNQKWVTNDNILASGEATGHAHRLSGDYALYDVELDEGDGFDMNGAMSARLLTVNSTATLGHEEHRALEIPAGDYIVLSEAEYEPERWKNVRD